jgi:Winged helix-turn-helix DNA-binding
VDPAQGFGSAPEGGGAASRWGFFTNHFLVLLCVADNPDLRVRDIAAFVGITERATQAILGDLCEFGYVERIRIGRRNRYKIQRSARFRHPLVQNASIGGVLDMLLGREPNAASA